MFDKICHARRFSRSNLFCLDCFVSLTRNDGIIKNAHNDKNNLSSLRGL